MLRRVAVKLVSRTSFCPSTIRVRSNIASTCFLRRNFSDQKKAPDEFYDENVEQEKEFFDLTEVVTKKEKNKGVGILTAAKASSRSWKTIEAEEPNDSDTPPAQLGNVESDLGLYVGLEKEEIPEDDGNYSDYSDYDEDANRPLTPYQKRYLEAVDKVPGSIGNLVINESGIANNDLGDYVDEFIDDEELPFLPTAMMNYNHPWRVTQSYDEQGLDEFIPDTSREQNSFDTQGARACEGKRQRHGLSAILKCHVIDLEKLSYLDTVGLGRFLSDDGEILARDKTGLCAKCQRKVAKTIKRSRNIGLVPHIGEYVIRDSAPTREGKHFHQHVAGDDHDAITSKTVVK